MLITKRAYPQEERDSNEHPLAQAVKEAVDRGFDGIELCLRAGAWSFPTSADWSPDMIESSKALCQQHGLSIASLSSDWAWAYASFHPSLKGWSRGVELLGEDAKLAQALGAHTILVHLATSKGSWADCKAVLKDAADAASEYGVALGYEANIWERIDLGGFDGLLRMVHEIGSPHFGVYLHNSYPRQGLPLHEEIEKAGHRLVRAMHSSSLVAGRVEIDWEKAIPAMKKWFSDGVYVFETNWEEATASKELVEEAITAYW